MRAVEPTEEELVEMGRANAESLGDDAFYIISAYLKKKSPLDHKDTWLRLVR